MVAHSLKDSQLISTYYLHQLGESAEWPPTNSNVKHVVTSWVIKTKCMLLRVIRWIKNQTGHWRKGNLVILCSWYHPPRRILNCLRVCPTWMAADAIIIIICYHSASTQMRILLPTPLSYWGLNSNALHIRTDFLSANLFPMTQITSVFQFNAHSVSIYRNYFHSPLLVNRILDSIALYKCKYCVVTTK